MLMNYEQLLLETNQEGLLTKEKPLRANKGRIKGNRIAIKSDMTQLEKKCILAEELGHFYTTIGDIMNQVDFQNRKQERIARIWAYDKLIGLSGLLNAYKAGCKNLHETAEYLEITEPFLLEAIETYKQKYGICATIDNYIIYFEPHLAVLELI